MDVFCLQHRKSITSSTKKTPIEEGVLWKPAEFVLKHPPAQEPVGRALIPKLHAEQGYTIKDND